MSEIILVSSCLAGINCRYDGTNFKIAEIEQMVLSGYAIPVCPELLGGLETPRICCEIINTDEDNKQVMNKNGENRTAFFEEGSKKILKIAKVLRVKKAILKSRSPSCGFGEIYDGTFKGRLIKGNGITADLLSKNNIAIYNEENFTDNL